MPVLSFNFTGFTNIWNQGDTILKSLIIHIEMKTSYLAVGTIICLSLFLC